MQWLPDVAQDFPAEAGSPGFFVHHNATGCGNDGYTQAAQHSGNLFFFCIYPKPGLAYTLQTSNYSGFALIVTQFNSDNTLLFIVDNLIAVDKAFFQKNLGDGSFYLGCRYLHSAVESSVGISDSGKHISNGVSHSHLENTSFPNTT